MGKSEGFLARLSRELEPAIEILILLAVWLMAFLIRIFSVIRYESIIHEFDPWFNYRTTRHLVESGLYEFWNWYDPESWYPLGRAVGPTVYPGLMSTAASIYWACHSLGFPVDIRNVCVFLAPCFAGLCAIATYLLTRECTGKKGPALFAGVFAAIVPSYISRSVAGSYDNEGVAIFALIFTFYLWIKSVNTGSIKWSIICSMSYFYMVAAWGGYSFIINIIPIYVLGLIIIKKFNMKVYVAYSIFYVVGSCMALQIPFVNYAVIRSSEHLASHGVFFVCQLYVLIEWIKKQITKEQYDRITRFIVISGGAIGLVLFFYLTLTGITRWSGRSLTLLDPTYAKKYIPIIASVSEHQPTTWGTFFMDLHNLLLFMPVGFYYCYKRVTYGSLFIALYGVLAVYFSCVMIRLLLVLAPAVCVLGGIGISELISAFSDSIFSAVSSSEKPAVVAETPTPVEEEPVEDTKKGGKGKKKPKAKKPKKEKPATPEKKATKIPFLVALVGLVITLMTVSSYMFHCVFVAAEAYSSPSIVLSGRNPDGSKMIIDDFREAYNWLRMNTDSKATIMSWWDYGY